MKQPNGPKSIEKILLNIINNIPRYLIKNADRPSLIQSCMWIHYLPKLPMQISKKSWNSCPFSILNTWKRYTFCMPVSRIRAPIGCLSTTSLIILKVRPFKSIITNNLYKKLEWTEKPFCMPFLNKLWLNWVIKTNLRDRWWKWKLLRPISFTILISMTPFKEIISIKI